MYDAKICVIFLINLFLFLRFAEMFQLPAVQNPKYLLSLEVFKASLDEALSNQEGEMSYSSQSSKHLEG